MDANQAQIILKEELESLKHLSERSKEARAPVQLDQQSVGRLSRMDAMQKQNMDIATEQRRQIRIQMIKAALKRIEAGDYGHCAICDEKIRIERLKFDPAVACCMSCRS